MESTVNTDLSQGRGVSGKFLFFLCVSVLQWSNQGFDISPEHQPQSPGPGTPGPGWSGQLR